MVRKILPPELTNNTDDGRSPGGKNEIITGGPMKYYNRRRVRKAFANKLESDKFAPIDSEWFKQLIQEITVARHGQKMSQTLLAEKLGTSQASVSRLEGGLTNPTVELLDRILTILDIDIELQDKDRP